MKKAIIVDNVSMKFNLASEKTDSLKEYFVKLFKGKLMYQEFYALKNVSFSVEKGDSLALLGANGSGKSTMLKCVSGIYPPTNGNISISGSISPMIELGAGFDMDLTARENIFLNGIVMGHSRKLLQSKFDEIVDFSELQDFLDVPVKNFSSGMCARLGFAIATIVKPEILIIDEVLAVGDTPFQKKCENKMNELRSHGTTMLFVSHSMDDVRKICNKAIWLIKGEKVMEGDCTEVSKAYQEWANNNTAFQ